MSIIIGVRFKKAGKVYYFDPDGIEFARGEHVIVETVRGVEYGEVVLENSEIQAGAVTAPLKKVLKKADATDAGVVGENKDKEREALAACRKKIEEHGLHMKLIDVEYTFDNNKIVFYFTANGRIDFRDLVRDLAGVFKTRIELRQIGVRDEAKFLGGLGPCGRPCCCSAFLEDFQPVSIKMAKEQNLSLSPTKISGLCGRLMCCLNYEQAYYESVAGKVPRTGMEVSTPDGGLGVVVDSNALTQRVKVKVDLPDGTCEARDFDAEELTVTRKRRPKPVRTEAPAAKKDAEQPAAEGEPAAEGDAPHKNGKPGARTGRPRDSHSRDAHRPEGAKEQRRPEEAKEPKKQDDGAEPRKQDGAKKPDRPKKPRPSRPNRESGEKGGDKPAERNGEKNSERPPRPKKPRSPEGQQPPKPAANRPPRPPRAPRPPKQDGDRPQGEPKPQSAPKPYVEAPKAD